MYSKIQDSLGASGSDLHLRHRPRCILEEPDMKLSTSSSHSVSSFGAESSSSLLKYLESQKCDPLPLSYSDQDLHVSDEDQHDVRSSTDGTVID